MRDRAYQQWLEESGIGDRVLGDGFTSHSANTKEGTLLDLPPKYVEYLPLVDRMVRILEILIEKQGGIVVGGRRGRGDESALAGDTDRVGWILREFELIDLLISQLELMPPGDRRRCLMTLQYNLAAADLNQDGDVDGFSVLKALLEAGFRLHRVNRVRLLRAVEEMGGKMQYSELCQVRRIKNLVTVSIFYRVY
jgi:hypothetical protein